MQKIRTKKRKASYLSIRPHEFSRESSSMPLGTVCTVSDFVLIATEKVLLKLKFGCSFFVSWKLGVNSYHGVNVD